MLIKFNQIHSKKNTELSTFAGSATATKRGTGNVIQRKLFSNHLILLNNGVSTDSKSAL